MTSWPFPRAVRAAVFAAVCVALAAAAHVGMSTDMGTRSPTPGVLAVGFAGTAAVTWLLAGRRGGRLTTGGLMVAAQGALHFLFSGTHSSPEPSPMGSLCTSPAVMADMPGMGGAAMSAGGAVGMVSETSWGMTAAHTLAALGCALLMRHGESALADVLILLRSLAFAVFLLPCSLRLTTPGPVRRHSPWQTRSPRLPYLCHALVRRGPPRSCLLV